MGSVGRTFLSGGSREQDHIHQYSDEVEVGIKRKGLLWLSLWCVLVYDLVKECWIAKTGVGLGMSLMS